MVRALEVAIDLGAEESLGERMVRIARDANCATVLDRDEHGAGVRTVVWAGAADDSRARRRLEVDGNC